MTADNPTIRPGMTVLMIGDSQVVGPYGEEMHRLISDKDAECFQYGMVGASPKWFITGHTSNLGWSERLPTGSVVGPYGDRHTTPKLSSLIETVSPDLIVLSLGGNVRKGYSDAGVIKMVQDLLAVAQSAKVPIVWVSSPQRRDDQTNPAPYARFTALLRRAVGDAAGFVDSSKHSRYVGGDGTHYTGSKQAIVAAQSWARGVFGELQDDGGSALA